MTDRPIQAAAAPRIQSDTSSPRRYPGLLWKSLPALEGTGGVHTEEKQGTRMVSATADNETIPNVHRQIGNARALRVRCERCTPGTGGYSRLLEHMVADDLITARDAATYATQPPAEAVAELIAHVRAVDAVAEARTGFGEDA
ncbi:hypothetical protein [Nocardia sp. NPDC057227]|uniref:hypothetical protein n=1 Tax=Nocardia sp. NPDC057227 TaxID=3346056 RepID=UPI00362B4211